MPAFTPNYFIEFPCASDTIDPTVFGTWANDIESAIETVQARSELARIRPRTSVTGTTNAVASGVQTTLNHATTIIADPRITNGTTSLTFTVAGVYMMTAQLEDTSGGLGTTSTQLTITGPGTQIIQRDMPSSPAAATYKLNISGLLVVAAGNTAVTSVLYTGAGPLTFDVLVTAAFICEV